MAPKETPTIEPEKRERRWRVYFYRGDPRKGFPVNDWYYRCISYEEDPHKAFFECAKLMGFHEIAIGDIIHVCMEDSDEEYYFLVIDLPNALFGLTYTKA